MKITKHEFLTYLDELRDLIEADDSMEGSLRYMWADEPGHYHVGLAFRTGNQQGQGGMLVASWNADDEAAAGPH